MIYYSVGGAERAEQIHREKIPDGKLPRLEVKSMKLDLVQFAIAVSMFQEGKVDYLIPSEIYQLANRLESNGYPKHAFILRQLLQNRWALA